jgi:tetratricopeptide (TPR) repeat protein
MIPVNLRPQSANFHDSKRRPMPSRKLRLRLVLSAVLLLAALLMLAAPLRAQEDSNSSYDPYHAEKDIEVGQFYMKKGDIDAAIDRFQDAIKRKPGFARPRLLLGEAYEKKGDKAQAIKYYKEYLEVLPKAPDAAKVRKRIEKLGKELRKDSSATSPSSESLEKPLRPVEMREAFLLQPEFRRV